MADTTRHPGACWCHGAASDANCPTRWNGLVGATNCTRRTPHRGHTWRGRHPWEWQTLCALRCRGVRLTDGPIFNALLRLRSRIADAYWDRKGVAEITPEQQTRLLARLDQALAANRDRHNQGRMIVCDDPDCQPYGQHYWEQHGDGPTL